jgi:hypothetical protein
VDNSTIGASLTRERRRARDHARSPNGGFPPPKKISKKIQKKSADVAIKT